MVASTFLHFSTVQNLMKFICILYIFLISVRFPSQKEPYEGLLWFILRFKVEGSRMSCHPFTLVVIKIRNLRVIFLDKAGSTSYTFEFLC